MKKRIARLRLDAETVRPLSATTAVRGAGFSYVVTRAPVCGVQPSNTQDGSTLTGTISVGSILCGSTICG
jgi:hypothetical protein